MQKIQNIQLYKINRGQGPRPASNGMNNAFTLIEMLTTFAIIGLLIGITAVYLRQTGPSNILRAGSQNLAANLRYAAELAVSTQIPHEVRFNNPTPAQYRIVALQTPERIITTVTLDSTLAFGAITLPGNVAQFNSLGAVGSPGVITLQHQNGLQKIIDIRPSGYVQIH